MARSTRTDLSEELFFEPEFLKGKKNSKLDAMKNKLRASSAHILNEEAFSLVKQRLSFLKTEFAGMETDPIALAVGVNQKEFQAFILNAALCYNQICLEEIKRCKSAKASAAKKRVPLQTLSAPGWLEAVDAFDGKASLATKVESIQMGLSLACWMQERGQNKKVPALMHTLDCDMEWRAFHVHHEGRQTYLDENKKFLKQEKRRMAIKRWGLTALAAVAGIAGGALIGMAAGFAVGAIGGPVTAIVGGILGAIGGAVAGGLVYAAKKPAKSYEYLSKMLDHGKKAYVMSPGKDKISRNYLIGELVKSERGRRIINDRFIYSGLTCIIDEGENKGKMPLEVLYDTNQLDVLKKYLMDHSFELGEDEAIKERIIKLRKLVNLSVSDESSESDNSSESDESSKSEKSSKSGLFAKSNSAIPESPPEPSNANNNLNTPKK